MVVIRQAQRARCTNSETIAEPMRQPRKSGTSRELFAWGLVIDSTLGRIANDWVTPSPSADARYPLRCYHGHSWNKFRGEMHALAAEEIV